MKSFRGFFLCLVVVSAFLIPRDSVAMNRTARVFVLTSTYGVMAGALTGVASLAFYKNPRGRLRNIAMGASLGLYVGILLGAYMIWALPDSNAPAVEEGETEESDLDPDNPLNLPSGGGEGAYFLLPEEPSFSPLLAYDPQSQTTLVGLQYRF